MEAVLGQLGLLNCLKHLSKISVATLADLQAASKNDIKALGFKPDVRSTLLRLQDGTLDGDRRDLEQVRFVTVDEEEQAKLLEVAVTPVRSKKKRSKTVAGSGKASCPANGPVSGRSSARSDIHQVPICCCCLLGVKAVERIDNTIE